MTHSFQFDPCIILGVASNASLSEIRDAYRQKSLKHHPDKGGDEWAFRMVARAYELMSTARVVERTPNEFTPPPRRAQPTTRAAEPPPRPKATWTNGFGPGAVNPGPSAAGVDPPSATNISGWGGAPRSHEGESPESLAKIVAVELLILRFELECSRDLFARSPEDRNLSCTLHITWPLADIADQAEKLTGASRTLRRIGEAFKAKGVRKHATTKRADVESGRFDAWLTYPTAVMASEALEALREALAEDGLEVEKQVREMAIPRTWK